MECDFTIMYPGSKAELLEKIRNTMGDKGRLSGDETQGNFEGSTILGKFEGTYSIEGDDIEIMITKKPFLVSCNRIKDEFEKALNEY